MDFEEASLSGLLPDNELVRKILGGQKNLYTLIVRRYNQRLYRVAMSILYDEAEAEDVMQTAYTNAYMNLGSFEFKASFSTWLTRILVNECILRLKRRGKHIAMNDESLDKILNQQQQKNDLKTPITDVMNAELKSILNDAIRRLPEIYRSVFVMREIENMSVAETKECLGISEVNVKVRLNRAKAMLKELLSSYFDKDEILYFHLNRCNRLIESVMTKIT